MTTKDIEHLEWIHGRMRNVHKENENTDYMLKFQEIIDELKNTVIKSHLRGINYTAVYIDELGPRNKDLEREKQEREEYERLREKHNRNKEFIEKL